ncbi:MAG: hypothetical protein COB46_00750 [Rhodospirillaceae bacterium]|nr:MAG: hypothetical protein COB46_00750 [Rhodospirillaceae bacterium]
MARTFQIGFSIVVLGTLGFAWTLFNPKITSVDEQIIIAAAVLDRARTDHTVRVLADVNWTILPSVETSKDRKTLFIAKMLPLIAEQNERILIQRARAETAAAGSAAYNGLIHDYGLKTGASRKALLARIDRIPESLTLAQAAIESGWGTSRFSQLGHAYFGERTYNKDVPGMAALRATGFKVKSFHSTSGSIRSFMRTLNTHRAYKAFRARRANLRAQGQKVTGADLAITLKSYSEIGTEYIDRILLTIRANNFGGFDGIEHVDH